MKHFVVALLVVLLVVGAIPKVSAEEPCIPCSESQSFSPLTNLSLQSFIRPMVWQKTVPELGLFSSFSASRSSAFNTSFAVQNLESYNSDINDQLQFTGGCYYRFVGSTRCINHTWYGLFCLSGSWYCYLIGTCKWIPIGSCQ